MWSRSTKWRCAQDALQDSGCVNIGQPQRRRQVMTDGAASKLSAFYTFTVLAVGFVVEQCSCRDRLELLFRTGLDRRARCRGDAIKPGGRGRAEPLASNNQSSPPNGH